MAPLEVFRITLSTLIAGSCSTSPQYWHKPCRCSLQSSVTMAQATRKLGKAISALKAIITALSQSSYSSYAGNSDPSLCVPTLHISPDFIPNDMSIKCFPYCDRLQRVSFSILTSPCSPVQTRTSCLKARRRRPRLLYRRRSPRER